MRTGAGQATDSATPSEPPPDRHNSLDHTNADTLHVSVESGDDKGHSADASRLDAADVIATITQLWRMRQRWHRAEKSLILQAQAICRAFVDGDKKAGVALFKKIRKGGTADATLMVALLPFIPTIRTFESERLPYEKRLRTLARSLPIWSWCGSVRGFGDLNLAALVGETTTRDKETGAIKDIGTYRGPACLWKRMGLAVVEGGRQRKSSNEAELHGYSPRRHAVAYLLSDTLIKQNKKGKYKTLYDERKVVELARELRPIHAHRRAARYMVKRVIRDLWHEWKACESSITQRAA
jgi:hypothetical protein